MAQKLQAGRVVLMIVGVSSLMALGIVLVVLGLREGDPEPTPTPSADSSLSVEDATSLPRSEADAEVEAPAGDLGPYVRTESVDPIWDEAIAGERTTGFPASQLVIPSLRVEATVEDQPVVDGAMSLPDDLSNVGRLQETAPLDAAEGTSLLAGHVTQKGDHGALFLLGLVAPGASVITTDADGNATVWVVTGVSSYNKTALPEQIFSATGDRHLAIVTCGGEILQTSDGRWTHEDNIVVTATPIA